MITSKYFSSKDRVMFMKKLAFLLGSGISFIESLNFIIQKETVVWKKEYLLKVRELIRSGKFIHVSFDVKPHLIDPISLRLIRSGEATGNLTGNCNRLAQSLEKKLEERNRFIGMLIYPVCIFLCAAMLILALVFFVFPKILPILTSSGVPLPFTTHLLLVVAQSIQTYGATTLGVMTMTVIVWGLSYRASQKMRKACHAMFLNIPFMGYVFKISKNASSASEISLYLESGHTLLESLHAIYEHQYNVLYRHAWLEIIKEVRAGKTFSKCLLLFPTLFPVETIQFISIGEESGNLSKILLQLSHFYNEEIKERQRWFLSLLEPLIMIVLGVVIGFVALSLISPIYSLTSSLSTQTP